MARIESCAYSHLQCWRAALSLFVVDEGVPGEKAAEAGPGVVLVLPPACRLAPAVLWPMPGPSTGSAVASDALYGNCP